MNWLAKFSRRHILTACLVVFFEVILYRQYASLDAEFHFWLHSLFGAAVGLSAVSIWKIIKGKSAGISGWEAGALGHIYSAVPDIIFIAFGVLHMYWMDVFAIHISIHFLPAPVATMLIIFLLSLVAYGLSAEGHRKSATYCLVIAASVLSVSLLFKSPVPSNLKEVQQHNQKYSWMCPMWTIDPRLAQRPN